jgi:anti-sigma factor RsiW
VDCNSVQQHAGSAIDGFLAKDVEHEFQAHLERCRPCREEVALEKLSKQLVQRYVSWIPTPRSLQTLVVTSLHQEYKASRSADNSWMTRVTRFCIIVPALAGGAVAAAFFLMVGIPSDRSLRLSAHTAENDIIHQSFETFALLKAGQLVPAMVSSAPESVGGFFQRSSLQFGVQIPNIRGCDWCGGSTSDNRGVKQAHLVYKLGDEWVYVCETSGDDAMSGAQLSLPPAAKIALTRSGWYSDPMHPNCNVVVWKKDEVVCVAVSTMGKKRLLALLTPPTNLPQQF